MSLLDVPARTGTPSSTWTMPGSLRRVLGLARDENAPLPRKALVINGHPDPRPERFCAALALACAEGKRAAGWETLELTLASFNWLGEEPGDEMIEAFSAYNGAEDVTLVFPLWLNEAPPILRQFLKQAPAEESAVYPARSRKFRIVVTMDMPAFVHRSTASKCRLSLPGIAPSQTVFIGTVGLMSPEKRAEWLRIVREFVKAPQQR